jgi:peptidoglycan hydrolase-like protein with peptidoglycan-binding domain
MRTTTLVASGLLAIASMPAVAQQAPPLSYVQPLPTPAVQSVQDRLRQTGAYNGRVDGIWGPDSVTALERFQQAHQLQVTGQLNQATAATLGLDPNALLATPVAAAPPPPPDHLQPASVQAVQSRLRALGFYNGPVDGVWGQGTQDAVGRLQHQRGLQVDGQLGPATITAMGLTPEALAYR